MSKRFIDISSLPKAFRKLTPSLKLTWFYLWNNCDASGVWEIDADLFKFENGFELEVEKLKELLSDQVEIYQDKILLKDYIRINYTKLKENYNPHKPVFRKISKNNLKLEPSLNQASFKLEDEDEDEEEYKEEYFGKSENLLKPQIEIDKIFLSQILDFFSIHESQEGNVSKFLFARYRTKEFEEFKTQTLAYIEFKKISGQEIHNWNNYKLSWREKDYQKALKNLKSKEVKSTVVIN